MPVRIDCPPSGWIPDSTRCEMIRASPICCVASACHYERAEKSIQNLVILSQAAAAYALAGRKDMARAMISGIEGQARERYVCGFNVASLYSVLGDKQQAFAWLEKAHLGRSD